MRYKITIFGLLFIAVISCIIFFLRTTPREELEFRLGRPLPQNLKIIGFGEHGGMLGAIMAYELNMSTEDFHDILKSAKYVTPQSAAQEKIGLKSTIEQYGKFKVQDLADFELYETERDGYSIHFLVKNPTVYCLLFR